MPRLLLRCAIDLTRQYSPQLGEGPVFHRWLPDGEADAAVASTGDPRVGLRLWFERCGFVEDNGFIRYERGRREVDPGVMRRQGLLPAGALRGELRLEEVDGAALEAVRQARLGDTEYLRLGKRVVTGLLYPELSRFVRALRVTFGQFWLRELEPWDSRTGSLGFYCTMVLRLTWSEDGTSWQPFLPDASVSRYSGSGAVLRYDQFPTEDQWREFVRSFERGYDPPPATTILLRAHELRRSGNLRHALIEAVTALEIAVDDAMRERLAGDHRLTAAIQSYWDLPLKARLTNTSVWAGLAPDDVAGALRAYEIRNALAHEGQEPPGDARQALEAVYRVVQTLTKSPRLLFPPRPGGMNELRPAAEDWLTEPRAAPIGSGDSNHAG